MRLQINYLVLMPRLFRKSLFLFSALSIAVCAQSLCPHYLVTSPMVVNIEGRFVNIKHSRVSMDIEWRHHPESIDTFFVNLPDREQFRFITTGDARYMETGNANVKRQLASHHLKENIGETPLKLDDMELLANGNFLCKEDDDTTKNFRTAFSMMWWSMMTDSLATPQKVVMRGANHETRIFSIGQWKAFSGEVLPTLVSLSSLNYSGNIWIRSAYPIQALESDPLQKKVAPKVRPIPELFLKIPVKRKREIPLILKLNQELLSE